MLLEQLDVDDLIECSRAFTELAQGASSMEAMGTRLTSYLASTLVTDDGSSACALVRLYKTHRLRDLPADLREFARNAAQGELGPTTRCLTLVATSGIEAAWNDRRRSRGHQAIPLTSVTAVEQLPMVVQLIRQFGLDVDEVVRPNPDVRIQRHHERFNLFYVPDAVGSSSVPVQDEFVTRYGVRSVVGCGGMLPNGDLFALILFLRVTLSEPTADLFRSLALSVKSAIVPFTFKVFAPVA